MLDIEKHYLQAIERGNELVIQGAQEEDSGLYVCTASNPSGSTTSRRVVVQLYSNN